MKDVSMGSTISCLVGETFLQLYEYLIVKNMVETNNIIFCNGYKDSISLIHNHTNTCYNCLRNNNL